MITNLTTQQIASVQFDEGLVVINSGESDERILAPTRGGGEFSATATVRDIDFDGRRGKTTGMQVIEEQAASLKVTTIGLTQENLAMSIPNAVVDSTSGANSAVKNPQTGYIPPANYLKNVVMYCKTLGGKYKKITIYNPMHEGGIGVKAVQKAEGELALEFMAHFPHTDLDGDLWKIEELNAMPSQTTTETTNG